MFDDLERAFEEEMENCRKELAAFALQSFKEAFFAKKGSISKVSENCQEDTKAGNSEGLGKVFEFFSVGCRGW